MGRSIEFWMVECEEEKFINLLNDDDDISIISAASSKDYPDVLKKFYSEGENIFWKKAYIVRNEDLDKLKMSYVESCSHYIIEDTFEAPVIEIRRGVKSKNGNARIYAELYYYKDGRNEYKGEDFENLYKKIETWIRINYGIIEPKGKTNRQYCYY